MLERSPTGLLDYDRSLGTRWVAGADEAGRGCVAGPLVAASVLFDLETLPERPERLTSLNDSKKLSAGARARLVGPILHHAARVVVVAVPARVIDERGIQHVNLHALAGSLERASRGLSDGQVTCLSDGFALPMCARPHRGIVKGDATSAAIAAASVIAKEMRDRMMLRLDTLYPGYGLAGHAGYPTKAHKQAIARLGPCPEHRMTFGALRAYTGG